jgi:hypothetical protein
MVFMKKTITNDFKVNHCFSMDTTVELDDGTFKQAKDVKIGHISASTVLVLLLR